MLVEPRQGELAVGVVQLSSAGSGKALQQTVKSVIWCRPPFALVAQAFTRSGAPRLLGAQLLVMGTGLCLAGEIRPERRGRHAGVAAHGAHGGQISRIEGQRRSALRAG